MYSISEWDTKHFGFSVAKWNPESVTEIENTVYTKDKLVISRVNQTNTEVIEELQFRNFRIYDTLITYRLKLKDRLYPIILETENTEYDYVLKAPVEPQLEKLGLDIFTNFTSHWFTDKLISKNKALKIYTNWIQNTYKEPSNELVDMAFSITNRTPSGFYILKWEEPKILNVSLIGVTPMYRRSNLYTNLMNLLLDTAEDTEASDVLYGTQAVNLVPFIVLPRFGFKPFKVEYTFHRWN